MNPAAAIGAAAPFGLKARRHQLASCAALPPHFPSAAPILAFQVKQAEALLERLTKERLLDKVTTVITGQTTVEPELVEKQFKAIAEEGYTFDDFRSEFVNNASQLWSSSYDLATNFNPFEVRDWLAGLLENFAERFAAWELSSLVALGERWLIWTPLVVLPMAWQMSKKKHQEPETKQTRMVPVAADEEKQERVRRELERIKWRTALLQQVETKASPSVIETSVKELQNLSSEDERFTMEDIDGNWHLVYSSSQAPTSLVPQLPGVQVGKLEQQIRESNSEGGLTTLNSTLIRLVGVGVIEVGVRGRWEQLTSMVSFDTFTARLVDVFGSSVGTGIPPLVLQLPVPFRQSAQWKLLYLDSKLRVNQGDSGQLYVFVKSE